MKVIGNKIIHLETTASTNSYAQNLISTNKHAEGTIVFTDFQTDGRGQGNNKWLSEKKSNLLMSLILKPDFLSPVKQFYLNMAVCLAVSKSLEAICGSIVKIKWPNDIMIGNKKIAGILIQNSLSKDKISSSIVGIGINVNQKIFEDSITNATSVAIETGMEKDIKVVLDIIIDNLRKFYYHLENNKLEQISKMYIDYLYGINEKINLVKKSGETIYVELLGVTESGEMLITENKELVKYNHDQVRIML